MTGSQQDLREEFVRLMETWKSDMRFISSGHERVAHPAYQSIIALGESVVPLLLKEMTERPDDWSHALSVITGENPVPPEAAGHVREMAKAWREWGRRPRLLAPARDAN